MKLDLFICFYLALGLAATIHAVYISNLDASCMRCICQAATGCNVTLACVKGYCGPFYISRIYWVDAGKYVLTEDDPDRDGAYQDCANDYNCAKYIVENYMAKFGSDCNSDGVTNCDDYAMIHYNGGLKCDASLEGKPYDEKYRRCRPNRPEYEDMQQDEAFPDSSTQRK